MAGSRNLLLVVAVVLLLIGGAVVLLPPLPVGGPRPETTAAPVVLATAAPVATPTVSIATVVPSPAPATMPPAMTVVTRSTTTPGEAPGVMLPSVPVDALVAGFVVAWPILLLALAGMGGVLALVRLRRMRARRSSRQLPQASQVSPALRLLQLPRRPQVSQVSPASPASRPALRLPKVSLPALRLPWSRPMVVRLDLPDIDLSPPPEPVPPPPAGLGTLAVGHVGERQVALTALLAGETEEVPTETAAAPDAREVAPTTSAPTNATVTATPWTAEDRALAVAGALAHEWENLGLRSVVLAIDATTGEGSGTVIVTVDPHPDDEDALLELPARLAFRGEGWQGRWRASEHRPALHLSLPGCGPLPPAGGPLLLPLLAHGGRLVRFVPLGAWKHLGLYGMGAVRALHVGLSSLLATQPPDALALALCDPGGQVAPRYAHLPHLVFTPGDALTTLQVVGALLHRPPLAEVRPVVLVLVNPQTAELHALTTLLPRLRRRPAAPLHLIVVQESLLSAGREVYATLPALTTGGGQAPLASLAGARSWPTMPEGAILTAAGLRAEGTLAGDEAQALAQLAELTGRPPRAAAPVLWDVDDGATFASDLQSPQEEPALAAAAAAAGVEIAAPATPAAEAAGVEIAAPATPAAAAAGVEIAAPATPAAAAAGVEIAAPATPAAEPGAEAVLGAEAAETDCDDVITWPRGPDDMTADEVGALVRAMVASPVIVEGRQPGVTPNRLKSLLLPERQHLTMALLLWMEDAEVLTPPRRPDLRWREPRPLLFPDLPWLAHQLRAFDPGDTDER